MVLDQQHGDVLRVADTADLAFEDVHLLMVQAGGGFIEQQQLGLGGQGAGELDALADGERQAAGRPVYVAAQFHELDQFHRPVARAVLLGDDRGQAKRVGEEARPGLAVAADHDVFQHREAIEQRDVLEGAADPLGGDAVAGNGQQGAALEQDVAGTGLVEPAQAVEQGCLAGAVRADQPDDLSGMNVEADLVQRHDATEAYSDVPHAEQWFLHAQTLPREWPVCFGSTLEAPSRIRWAYHAQRIAPTQLVCG